VVYNTDISWGPSGLIFNNLIYVFHQGIGDNGQLWFNTFNPSNGAWAGDVNVVLPAGIAAGVSPVAFSSTQMFVFYTQSDGSLCFLESIDGQTFPYFSQLSPPNTASTTPNAIIFNNVLYVFYQAWNSDGYTFYYQYSLSSSVWSGPFAVNAGITQGPQAIIINEVLYLFHQGFGGAGQLYYKTFDGTNWATADNQITYLLDPINSASGPTPAYINGYIYPFYVGVNGLVYFSAVTPSGGQGPVDQVYNIAGAIGEPSVIIY